jgi:fatty acid desaturase
LEGVVTWPQLAFVAGLTIAANATTAIFVGWMVLAVCRYLGTIERRLQRLEILNERRGE